MAQANATIISASNEALALTTLKVFFRISHEFYHFLEEYAEFHRYGKKLSRFEDSSVFVDLCKNFKGFVGNFGGF